MPRKSKSLDEATPGAIARAGLEILENRGAAELSFRSIAAHLAVSHTTVVRRGGGDFNGLVEMLADHLALDLPEIAAGSADWADATERRFVAWYTLLTAYPGLVMLRGPRPWLGPHLLTRLTEPQLADNVSLGLSPGDAFRAYRECYLYTLGCAGLVEHRDRKPARLRTRSILAALDPDEYPILATNLDEISALLTDDVVFRDGLRRLIASWADTARAATAS
ncbi:TetR/AcrR family transcriptional regulator [Nocardia sp. ET3-3]|uniref:TetR/AcrR family transcriptional regulator n=1 Tax=Nocardia terrae TaxID=2675851 RepID=A0A7K1UT15_9NOCA|nr:TetR/AcrR family transcriptional regulator C-terminal domain-containing protein [Nocardia terrae]MVU77496.1 TetR/AcrR family transcriptional regulator [Nocardia terrae]